MSRMPMVALATILLVTGLAATGPLDASPAAASGVGRHRERHAYGLPAPTGGAASRHVWGGWIGSWRDRRGQLVFHLDPQASSGRSTYGTVRPVTTLRYRRRLVSSARREEAGWILSTYGATTDRAQAAAVELAIDDLLVGGGFALGGRTTRTRLLLLDGSTRTGVLRLAGQLVQEAQQHRGPSSVRVSKAGTSDATSTMLAVTVVGSTGRAVPRSQVSVRAATGSLTAATGPHGEPALVAVPRSAVPQRLEVTASVPTTALLVATPARPRLSRVALGGLRVGTSVSATLTPATVWTLGFEQHYTTPASDTRTYQTLHSGTFQDSWTCAIPKGSSSCQDPAGNACSHNVALNSGTWTDAPSMPSDGYRAGNTCVWRHYAETSSRVVQTGGSYTPAQEGWQPMTVSYTEASPATTALAACERAVGQQRSCALTDDAALSAASG